MVWSMNKAFLISQPVENDIITYDNIWKIATDQGEDHTIECLLDYNYFIEYCSMIAIYLNKQQALDDDPNYWKSKRNCFGLFTSKHESIVHLFFFDISVHNIKL